MIQTAGNQFLEMFSQHIQYLISDLLFNCCMRWKKASNALLTFLIAGQTLLPPVQPCLQISSTLRGNVPNIYDKAGFLFREPFFFFYNHASSVWSKIANAWRHVSSLTITKLIICLFFHWYFCMRSPQLYSVWQGSEYLWLCWPHERLSCRLPGAPEVALNPDQ